MSLGVAQSDLGVGNRLTLLDDELLKNLADIQLRGGLPPSGSLTSGDFTVEMETGTGKTYVPAHDLRAEQALRLQQVRDRGAVGGDQGRCLQNPANHRGTLQGALRGRAFRLLSVRLGQARPSAQLCYQFQHPDHGRHRRCHQQEGCEQSLQGQRKPAAKSPST